MNVVTALMVTRLVTRLLTLNELGEPEGIPFRSAWWFIYAGISFIIVIFAGIMSGLTLGLMTLSLVDLEILRSSGSSSERKQAVVILPVVQKQHQLLVTLLLCNAVAMEALPICLDKIFNQYVAIILSVTFVLFFGEVIPQAICSRYGLAVAANLVWLVRFLMIICYLVAYPIGKVLDWLLGDTEALFRRAQLKALVSIHSQEAGKGGELTHNETTIISGALDLTEKTAEEAMTPIESTFSLEFDSKLDRKAMEKILARGHSRVPVYSGNPKNIIAFLLVKDLLIVQPETETSVNAYFIRIIPRVPSDMPLYDVLNEFQKGSSHMAAVVRARTGEETYEENKGVGGDSELTAPLLQKQNIEDEVIGIITLEDVFEELLQEEIVDETDEYVDVHKRIRVAAAAAASSGSGSIIRRLTSQKGARGQSMPGLTLKQSAEEDGSIRSQ